LQSSSCPRVLLRRRTVQAVYPLPICSGSGHGRPCRGKALIGFVPQQESVSPEELGAFRSTPCLLACIVINGLILSALRPVDELGKHLSLGNGHYPEHLESVSEHSVAPIRVFYDEGRKYLPRHGLLSQNSMPNSGEDVTAPTMASEEVGLLLHSPRRLLPRSRVLYQSGLP
jgi:hypothetical protein